MKSLKLLIYKIFGLKTYLQIVSRTYIGLIKMGYGKAKYPEIHFLKALVKPDFQCIDIGANLGYFSYFMSKYAGKNGKIYSVEPIPLFGEIFKKNVTRTSFNNVELLPYALGNEQTTVQMGMPRVEGSVHHGMTKVIETEGNAYEQTFSVPMQIPDELFANIDKIDFIKIDVEGYEHNVFANMLETLAKHHPIIEAELAGEENRKQCVEILTKFDYKPHVLCNNALTEISLEEVPTVQTDLYFL